MNVPLRHSARHVAKTPFSKALRQIFPPSICVFLVAAFITGGSFLYAFGPLTIPDPGLHSTATYAVATGQYFNEPVDVVDDYGNHTHRQTITGDSTVLGTQGKGATVTDILQEFWFDDARDSQYQQLIANPTQITIPVRSNQYPPILYVPQGIGMAFARALHGNGWMQLQSARAANLLCYTLVGFISLLLIEKYRRGLLVLILVNPVSMFLASALSCDANVLALATLIVALFLNFSTRRPPAWQFIIFTTLLCLLIPFKMCYYPLIVLVFLLPTSTIPIRGKILIFVFATVIGLTSYLLWSRIFGLTFATYNVADNFNYILHHPITIFLMLLASAMNYMWQMLSNGSLASAVFLLIFIVFLTKTQDNVPLKKTLAITSIAIISLMMVLGAILLTWNDASTLTWGNLIRGFQERYAVPLLPLLVVLLPSQAHTQESVQQQSVGTLQNA